MILVLRNLALEKGYEVEVVVLEYDSSIAMNNCNET
jgi:hypothetical protein